MVEAQAWREREAPAGELQFILHEDAGLARFALGKIVDREVVAGQRFRHHAGGAVVGGAVAHLAGLRAQEIHTGNEPMTEPARGERLVGLQVEAGLLLAEAEQQVHVAQAAAARGARATGAGVAAHLVGHGVGFALLVEHRRAQAIDDMAGRLPFVVQADAVARQVLGAAGGSHARQRGGQAADVGKRIVVAMLVGQPEAMAHGRVQHDLAKPRIGLAVLRIGLGAAGGCRVVAAHAFHLMPLAVGVHEQALDGLVAARHARALAEAAVDAVPRQARFAAHRAAAHDVLGVLGDIRHHAADGVRAVQAGGRPAQRFDPLEEGELGRVAGGAGQVGRAAAVVVVGQAHAVDHQQHAVALDAADIDAAGAKAAPVARHVDIGFVGEQAGLVDRLGALDTARIDGGDGGGDGIGALLSAGGGDHHLAQAAGRIGIGVGSHGRTAKGGADGDGRDSDRGAQARQTAAFHGFSPKENETLAGGSGKNGRLAGVVRRSSAGPATLY